MTPTPTPTPAPTASGATAWFHCFAGTAGDMTMGALVDAGADAQAVAAILACLDLNEFALTFEAVLRCGISATRAVVVVDAHDDHHDQHQHRSFRDIRQLIERADLPVRVRARSLATFAALAEVEGAIHGCAPLDVEFHEVGSLDAIVDVVGCCAALEVLGIDRIVCSPIAVSRGEVGSAHGLLPTPAPAVVSLLARRHAPTFGLDDRMEVATPTGVALMTALADEFGPLPPMRVRSAGYGAGSADTAGRPNVVQVVIGDTESPPVVAAGGQPVRLLEVNVDDVTGEVIAHTIASLLAAGAHDAWATPIVMKKGRPAHTIHALCDPATTTAVGAVMLGESGSLGIRGSVQERWPQQRTSSTVSVEGHPIRIKSAPGRIKVEHDDAAAAARALGWPLRAVLTAAEALGWAAGDLA